MVNQSLGTQEMGSWIIKNTYKTNIQISSFHSKEIVCFSFVLEKTPEFFIAPLPSSLCPMELLASNISKCLSIHVHSAGMPGLPWNIGERVKSQQNPPMKYRFIHRESWNLLLACEKAKSVLPLGFIFTRHLNIRFHWSEVIQGIHPETSQSCKCQESKELQLL